MKVTAFTCLVGQTPDRLRVPGFISPSVRYVCLSDRPSSPFPYVHVPVSVPSSCSAPLYARQLKILADHPALGEPDVTLWHDAAFRLDIDPALVARQMFRGHPTWQVAALRHPYRTQIEAEAAEVVRLGYADAAAATAQVASYRAAGWTTQAELTSTGYLLRRRTPIVHVFNAAWWSEVERWSWRDQLSVDFALWTAGLACHYLEGHYRANPYATWFTATHQAKRFRITRPSWSSRRPTRRS